MSQVRAASGLAIACCLVLALAAAPTLAKKKHKKKPASLGPVVTVSAVGNTTTAEGDESTATATCPAGTQAVGGGFSAPIVTDTVIVPHTSFRSSVSSWTAVGHDRRGIGAITAYVYCRNTKKHVISDVAESFGFTASSERKTLSPSCPAGTQLIGGGFEATGGTTPTAFVVLQSNFASSPSAWTVDGINNGSAAKTMTAHAYCMAQIKPPTFVSQSSTGLVDELAAVPSTTPGCPVPRKPKKSKKSKKHKKPVTQLLSGGGFTVPTTPEPIAVFGESRIGTAGGWLSSAVNAADDPVSLSLTSQGICL
jgi:hypothetical protein